MNHDADRLALLAFATMPDRNPGPRAGKARLAGIRT